MSRTWRAVVGLVSSLVLLGCAVFATSAWVSAERAPRGATARAGSVSLEAGHVLPPDGDWVRPATSTPVVAWLRNDGELDHVLQSVSSPYARDVVLTGTALPLRLRAHDWLVLGTGGRGLALRDLTRPVTAGQRVPVTFRFHDLTLTTRLVVVGADTVSPSPSPSPATGSAAATAGSATPAPAATTEQPTKKKKKKGGTTGSGTG